MLKFQWHFSFPLMQFHISYLVTHVLSSFSLQCSQFSRLLCTHFPSLDTNFLLLLLPYMIPLSLMHFSPNASFSVLLLPSSLFSLLPADEEFSNSLKKLHMRSVNVVARAVKRLVYFPISSMRYTLSSLSRNRPDVRGKVYTVWKFLSGDSLLFNVGWSWKILILSLVSTV